MSTSPFPLPLAFTSQAFKKNPGGPEWPNAVEDVTSLARRVGVQTIGVQFNTGWHGEVTADEVKRLKSNGFWVVAWGHCNEHTAQQVRELGVNGFMPQVESFGQFDQAVRSLTALRDALLPVSVVTDWNGLDGVPRADTLRALGATTVFVEAYAEQGQSHADLAHYVAYFAGTRGYTSEQAIPLLGTYRDEPPSAYKGVDAYAGPRFAVYLLETIAPRHVDAWRTLAASQPPPTNGGGGDMPSFKNAAEARTYLRQVARAWEKLTSQPDPWSRANVVRRVADSDDAKWAKAREKVAKALDDAGVAK
jgi:hypothetical protein